MSRYSGTDVDSPGWTGTITADSRRDTVYAFFDSRKDTTDMAAFMKTAADTPLSLYRVPGRGEEQGTLYVNQDE